MTQFQNRPFTQPRPHVPKGVHANLLTDVVLALETGPRNQVALYQVTTMYQQAVLVTVHQCRLPFQSMSRY